MILFDLWQGKIYLHWLYNKTNIPVKVASEGDKTEEPQIIGKLINHKLGYKVWHK